MSSPMKKRDTIGANHLKDVLEIVNRLQDVFIPTGIDIGLDLPQIAVVGGQSAGKSSVLEGLVGTDFLPRGSDIVTRRPLVMQLRNSDEDYAQFQHCPGEKFTDFNMVRNEIEEVTDKATGSMKGISKVPIQLKIYSPSVPDLTLVDLPGLTKIPIADQPDDIEYQIRSLVLDYIRPENTLILAVTPATQDIANSDALKIARDVDPDGNRTIGVITKLDLMDAGTDAKRVLDNKVFYLKRGYIGVVNRSQKDIDCNKGVKEAVENEMHFFKTHPCYKAFADRMGISYLQKYLNSQLLSHIREKLPIFRAKLLQKQYSINGQLSEMGALNCTPHDREKLLYRIVNDFQELLSSVIEGNSNKVDVNTVQGGAIINQTFYTDVYDLLDIDNSPSIETILVTIKNYHGIHCPLFLHEQVVDKTVKELILRYREPLLKSVTMVTTMLMKIVESCARIFHHFPLLHQEVLFLLNQNIQLQDHRCKEALLTHIKAEASFINTRHPDFRKNSREDLHDGYTNSLESCRYETLSNSTVSGPHRPQDKALFQIINNGWFTLAGNGFKKGKLCWIQLTSDYLTVYRDQRESDEKYRVSLDQLRCGVRLDKKALNFVFYKGDKPVCLSRDGKKLILSTNNRAHADIWIECFKQVGVIIENKGSLVSLNDTASSMILSKDDDMREQAIIIAGIVNCYMDIIDKTIHDITPKYIMLILIQSVLQYVKQNLLADLLEDRKQPSEKESLMQGSSEDMKMIEDLRSIKQATDRGVTVLADVFSSP